MGVLVGILGMVALTSKKGKDSTQHLKDEIEAGKEFQEKSDEIKENEVREILKANEDFLRSISQTEDEFKEAISNITKEKKEKILKSQESGDAAKELAELLGLKVK